MKSEIIDRIKQENQVTNKGVPYTVVEDSAYLGFNTTISSQIEEKIQNIINNEERMD